MKTLRETGYITNPGLSPLLNIIFLTLHACTI